MVMTSDQIASMSAQFQQQSMMNMQHSGMISQFAGAQNTGERADTLAGGIANTGAALAGPMATGGLMLAGMDPFSLAFRAGTSKTAGALGMAGRIGMGAAAGMTGGAAFMGAQYAGGQVLTGMQQQQQLRSHLDSGFGHMNAQGGRGFTRQESSTIGEQFRHMTEMRGPGGEFTSMDELGRLAANMGRMGMAQGVKDAKDFREKFSKMMDSVKEIATEFSTSLEEAQKIMGSMRGAGVFNQGQQVSAAKAMTSAAIGTDTSVDAFAQMGNIGSQVSRSIGGRGKSGLAAGVGALRNVAGALQSGALSEEDIYNATGLTGERGKQAMATNMLRRDAGFLKGNRGRQLLAAIAKEDGSIDMEAVRKIQTGQVSVQDTVAMRGDHLNSMSRANFIRNEGRLRGEALAAFGGHASSLSHMGWLKGKGFDPSSMDDKAMLAFQRHTGMDRDEADAEIKMLRNVRNTRDVESDRRSESEMMRSLEQRNKTVGIEGLKRRFESKRQELNNKLQQTGADILTSGESMLEQFFNKVTGEYTRRVEAGLSEASRLALQGAGGDSTMDKLGLKRDITAGGVKNMEKVFGAKLATGDGKFGAPIGDVEALSGRARSTALADFMTTDRGADEGPMGILGSMADALLTPALSGGAKALGSVLGIGQMSESDRARFGDFMERDDVLTMNRQMLGADSPEEKQSVMKAQRDKFLDMVKDKKTNSASEIAAQKKNYALSMRRAGKTDKQIMAQLGASGFTEEDLETLDEHEAGIAGTLAAQDIRKVRQGIQSFADSLGGIKNAELGDFDRALYGGKEFSELSEEEQAEATRARDLTHGFMKKLGYKFGDGKGLKDIREMERLASTGNPKDVAKAQKMMREVVGDMQASRGDLEDVDAATLDRLAAAGIDGLSGMAEQEAYEDRAFAAARKSGRKGASLQTFANLMGGELDADVAKELHGLKGPEQRKAFMKATGLGDLDYKQEAKIGEMLEALGKGKAGVSDVDKLMTEVNDPGLREAFREGIKNKQDDAATLDDPQFRKLDSIDKHMADLITIQKNHLGISSETLQQWKDKDGGKEQAGA